MSIDPINLVDLPSAGIVPLQDVAIRLHREDQVAIAKTNLQAGTTLILGDNTGTSSRILLRGFIPS
ncbi:MAG: hypothetical protein GY796_24670, partial [Chloroflexi bacterium]|nr:hypothetical protein [Chloroflexota bacterium]